MHGSAAAFAVFRIVGQDARAHPERGNVASTTSIGDPMRMTDALHSGSPVSDTPLAPVLFFTCANRAYEDFVGLYIFCALWTMPSAIAEVGVEDVERFYQENSRLVAALGARFPGRFLIRTVDWTILDGKSLPHSVRFLTEPLSRAEHVYIGDIDVLHLDRAFPSEHLAFMAREGLPYANSVRPGTRRMSGLHFSRWDAMYPIVLPTSADLAGKNDEMLLADLLEKRGLPIQNRIWWRPVPGIHISPNREPQSHVTPEGRKVPGWGITPWIKYYQRLRKDKGFRSVEPYLDKEARIALDRIDEALAKPAATHDDARSALATGSDERDGIRAKADLIGPWQSRFLAHDGTAFGGEAEPLSELAAFIQTGIGGLGGGVGTVLDLRAGEGALAMRLAASPDIQRVVGVEHDRANLIRARFANRHAGSAHVSFVDADDAATGEWDLVVCSDMLPRQAHPWVIIERAAALSRRYVLIDAIPAELPFYRHGGYVGELHPNPDGSNPFFWPTLGDLMTMTMRYGLVPRAVRTVAADAFFLSRVWIIAERAITMVEGPADVVDAGEDQVPQPAVYASLQPTATLVRALAEKSREMDAMTADRAKAQVIIEHLAKPPSS